MLHKKKFNITQIFSPKIVRIYCLYGIYWAAGGHLMSLDPSMEDFEGFSNSFKHLNDRYVFIYV
jgi:hypothetical protein